MRLRPHVDIFSTPRQQPETLGARSDDKTDEKTHRLVGSDKAPSVSGAVPSGSDSFAQLPRYASESTAKPYASSASLVAGINESRTRVEANIDMGSMRGQSLVELLVAIGIGTLFIVGAVGALAVTLRLEGQSSNGQPATELTSDLIDRIRTLANADWHNFDGLLHDGTHYQVTTSTTFYTISAGTEDITLNSQPYQRYFTIEDVARTSQDEATSTGNGILDPSTLKITTVTQWDQYGQTNDVRIVQYLTRIRDRLWMQTDWSGGPSGAGATTNPENFFTSSINAKYDIADQLTIDDLSANLVPSDGSGIDIIYKYAWGDSFGWIDFLHYGNVTIAANATTTGYASSSLGQVALDCATSPNNYICSTSLFGVTQNGSGVLSGWAWNDGAGWISFNCASENLPTGNCAAQGGVDHQVAIDAQGFFTGWAWSDVLGWISFNCDHSQPGDPLGINTCPLIRGGDGSATDYAVKTGVSTVSRAELISLIFDTSSAAGVAPNTITWYGDLPPGTRVAFQIASGNTPTGLWTTNFVGDDGTANSYYRPISPGIPLKLKRALHNDSIYLRYRVILDSNPARTLSPIVEDIMINYSL